MGELNPTDIAGSRTAERARRMLGRAALKHCPRCGTGHLFTSWWKMKERCPKCDLHFEGRPEEGHFLGAITINTGLTAGILLLGIWLYVIVLAVSDGKRPVGVVRGRHVGGAGRDPAGALLPVHEDDLGGGRDHDEPLRSRPV